MSNDYSLFIDYDNVLIGRADRLSPDHFYGIEHPKANHRQAIILFKYVLENVLCWDIKQSISMFDEYIVKLMKLERMMDYIQWPADIIPGDTKFLLSLIYPDKLRVNIKQAIYETYRRVREENKQFPREYFNGTNGYYRFCTCLSYLFKYIKPMNSIPDMYEFINSPEGKKFLFDYRLKIPSDHLNIDLYNCLYTITSGEESTLYYHYFSFHRELNKIIPNNTIKFSDS